MKINYRRIILLLSGIGLLLLLTSCAGEDEKSEPEPQPEPPSQGMLRIEADWKGLSDGVPPPETYFLRLDDTLRTLPAEGVYTYPAPLNPGRHSLLAYNEAGHITVSGGTATIDEKEDGTLQPMPDYLFSSASEVSILAGDTLKTTLQMQRRIHPLTLKLELAAGDEERILRTDAVLTGIIPALDLATGKPVGSGGKKVAPLFSIVRADKERAAGSTCLVATLHIAGAMTGERQHFTLHITLKDDTPRSIGTDLTEQLEDFGNSDEPFQLEAALTLPVDAGATATIGAWKRSDEYIEIEDTEE